MTEYHTVYKGPEGESTQWEDIHRKLGNLPPKEPVWKPDAYTPDQEEAKDQACLDKKDEDELSDMEDDFADDRFMEEYRQRRLAELRAAASTPRFGTVEDIRGSEFVQKVSEASASGTWVVVLLHKEHSAGCQLLGSCLAELARSYPETKFVRIVSTDCIPSYPDRNLPTLLLYHNGACKQHLVGAAMYGGAAMTPERVALVLNSHGQVCGGEGAEAAAAVQEAQVKGLVARLVAERERQRDEEDVDSD